MKTLAVDFDGVIHGYSKGWQDGSVYDEPIEGSIAALKKLSTQYRLVILTTRPNRDDIREWLTKHGFTEEIEITDHKVQAQAYIDDRGIRFTNWKDITNLFYSSNE